jgi:hypothetical protein
VSEDRRGWEANSHPRIPTSRIFQDMLAILREMPLTDEQLEKLYATVKERYDKHRGK